MATTTVHKKLSTRSRQEQNKRGAPEVEIITDGAEVLKWGCNAQ
jgi:hypothetical protein